MSEALLAEFPPTSTVEWEAAIARDLKGADYEKVLVTRQEGLAIKPYYRAEDTASFDWLNSAPGEFPYARGSNPQGDWCIRESIESTDLAEANRAALAAVAAGTEAIAFSKLTVNNQSDLALLFSGLKDVPVRISHAGERVIRILIRHLNKSSRTAEVSAGFDPLENVDFAAQTVLALPPLLVPFTIDDVHQEEAGANVVQQIGFTLAAGVDYLSAMNERGVDAARAAAAVEFGFPVGGNFFLAIAKLRAFRMLWACAVQSFGAPESGRVRIAARTSRLNKTLYGPRVNILRATTEAMSAILGGANFVNVAPFDACYCEPDEASRRLARNTQLILKKEAMLGRVADPGGGAYALESITAYYAREGWKCMQEVEARGGCRQAADWITSELEQSMAMRESFVASRHRIFVATNQYANAAEKALARIEPARFAASRRATRAYEELRLRTERHTAAGGKLPRVLLAEIGDAKMRAARSRFAANFFACAGFDIDTRRFATVDEVAASEADLIVLCSSDSEYAALAAELIAKLRAAGRVTPVIIAGNPENAEQLKTVGVADFVHLRSKPLEVLAAWQQRLGIKD